MKKRTKKILKFTVLTLLALFSLLIVGVSVADYYEQPKFAGRENFDELVNQYREANKLPTLVEDSTLNHTAQLKCEDMINRHYFAHIDPDGLYVWQTYPFNSEYGGENLAEDFYDSNKVVESWKSSKEHNDNLISPNFKYIGHAVCWTGDKYYVVELFKG